MNRIRRMAHAWVPWALILHLAGCGWGYPVKEPVAVTQQAQLSASIRAGSSTRESVRATLGEPWLQSHFWGFDLFRVTDTSTEVGGLLITIWPVPIGKFTSQVEGYVLITYDNEGRVAHVSSGHNTPRALGEQDPIMLRARDLNFGTEAFYLRGPQLMADPGRLQGYIAQRKHSLDCTLVLACVETKYLKWPYESCPDRVVIDSMAPINPQPFYGVCDPGSTCPPNTARKHPPYAQVPLVHPISLIPGTHHIQVNSSTFKGQLDTDFTCSPGEVRYGIIRGTVAWDWWSPRTSTLKTSVDFEVNPPPELAPQSMLLYRKDRWFADPEPGQF